MTPSKIAVRPGPRVVTVSEPQRWHRLATEQRVTLARLLSFTI